MHERSLSLALLLSILLVLVGCDRNGPTLSEASPDAPRAPSPIESQSRVFDGRDSVATGIDGFTATQANFSIMTEFVRVRDEIEQDFVEITDPDNLAPDTPLYESRQNEPILAPDGERHVTWGAFRSAEGAVIVKCTRNGTHLVTHLSGLLPKGVYSVWIDVFAPGASAPLRIPYTEIDEKGKSKGNVVRASAQGEGHISGFVPPRALDGVQISACMLEDVKRQKYDWRVVGIYHIDGTPGIGDAEAGTFVEHVAFAFETEESVERPLR